MLRLIVFVLLLLPAGLASAEVSRLEIISRKPYAEGKPRGDRGAYELIDARVYYELDPKLPANQNIVDLALASTNARGRVEFWTDVEIFAPVDLSQANGAIFYEVNNRGGRGLPPLIQGGADDFLLRQGFIVVRSGWIGEVLPDSDGLRMLPPVARLPDGHSIVGPVRGEVSSNQPEKKISLTYRGRMGSYRPTVQGLKDAVLTMREREADRRQIVPRDQWNLIVTDISYEGRPWPLPLIELEVRAGVKPGWLYEIVYEAQDPVVQGAGMAGIRDLVSFLRHDTSDRNPIAKAKPTRTLSFGVSQSGRLLRQFLFDGFNADEEGRRVFDGVVPHVAGGGLGSFNHRFASPTRTSCQHDEHLFPTDVFPFTYGDSTDPITGQTDGILRRARASNTVPKVFHTQSSSEYWHRAGSLVHTTPEGLKDVEIPDEVRIYTFAGTQHGSGSGTPATQPTGATLVRSPIDYRPVMRALVLALDSWIKDDNHQPPPSCYPTIADGTLADWKIDSAHWPAVPGVEYPKVIHTPAAVNRGPQWLSHHIASIEPPEVVGQYVVRVPVCDADGNERGCLKLPAVAVPVATFTGWNLRNDRQGAAGELIALAGGYIPFPRTAEERIAAGDPRAALLERYKSLDDYEAKYMMAAADLAKQHYLLDEDLPRLKQLCRQTGAMFEAPKP